MADVADLDVERGELSDDVLRVARFSHLEKVPQGGMLSLEILVRLCHDLQLVCKPLDCSLLVVSLCPEFFGFLLLGKKSKLKTLVFVQELGRIDTHRVGRGISEVSIGRAFADSFAATFLPALRVVDIPYSSVKVLFAMSLRYRT